MPDWMRRATIGLIALSLICGIAFYVYYDRHIRYFQETNDARIEADQVTISSKLAGYVRSVPVADNQPVTRGALLVEIDPVDYQTRLSAAEADMAAARAAQSAAEASELESQAAVAEARAALAAAQASLAFAKRETDRYGPLVKAGAEPESRLSQLISQRDQAAAEVAARKAALSRAETSVNTAGAQAKNAAARFAAARVQRQMASHDLASTSLSSPIAGKVANRTVQVGQYVQPGQRLMTIVPDKDLYVVANFKETQVGLMRPGQPAKIRIDALPGVDFTGEVISITPGTGANFSLIKPDNATGNFTKIVQRVPVRIRIDAGPAASRVLAPGLSLVVEVDTRASRDEIDVIRKEQEQAAR